MIARLSIRVAAFGATLVAASILLFLAINVLPGSAARSALGIDATPQAIARFEAERGLDRPLLVQYADWARGVLAGDFGRSFQSGVDVGADLLARIPVTLELALLAFIIANAIAVPLGLAAGLRPGSARDRSASVLASLAGAIPSFVVALTLVLLFTHRLGWLPPSGFTSIGENLGMNLRQMMMPALALGIGSTAVLLRIMRNAIAETRTKDYVRTAVAKGVGPTRVLWHHIVPNALPPYLNVAAIEFSVLFGSVVIIEDTFLLPGVGSMVLVGILDRDYPVLLAGALTITVLVLVANFVVDLVTGLLDPRPPRSRV